MEFADDGDAERLGFEFPDLLRRRPQRLDDCAGEFDIQKIGCDLKAIFLDKRGALFV